MKDHPAPQATYYAPTGGLPPQTALHTGRAVFTEAYAVIPKGVYSDIVTSYLPHWDDDPRLDHRPPALRLRRDLLAVHHGGLPRRRQRPTPSPTPAPKPCSSSSKAAPPSPSTASRTTP